MANPVPSADPSHPWWSAPLSQCADSLVPVDVLQACANLFATPPAITCVGGRRFAVWHALNGTLEIMTPLLGACSV